jgi:hypothetical protein
MSRNNGPFLVALAIASLSGALVGFVLCLLTVKAHAADYYPGAQYYAPPPVYAEPAPVIIPEQSSPRTARHAWRLRPVPYRTDNGTLTGFWIRTIGLSGRSAMSDFDRTVERRAAIWIGVTLATVSGAIMGSAFGGTILMIFTMAKMVRAL